MAPPTLVHTRAEIWQKYQDQLLNPSKYQCQLRSITQHECTFKMNPDSAPEIICLPFQRLFQRCLEKTITNDKTGKKIRGEKWVSIEITEAQTNADLMEKPIYGTDVKDFLNADKEFRKLMETELSEQ